MVCRNLEEEQLVAWNVQCAVRILRNSTQHTLQAITGFLPDPGSTMVDACLLTVLSPCDKDAGLTVAVLYAGTQGGKERAEEKRQ